MEGLLRPFRRGPSSLGPNLYKRRLPHKSNTHLFSNQDRRQSCGTPSHPSKGGGFRLELPERGGLWLATNLFGGSPRTLRDSSEELDFVHDGSCTVFLGAFTEWWWSDDLQLLSRYSRSWIDGDRSEV